MKFFVTVASGFEKEAREEIRRILKGKTEPLFMKGLLFLEAEESGLIKLREADTKYISHIYPIEKVIDISKIRECIDKIADVVAELNGIKKSETFAVVCERRGTHNFSSRDVILSVADRIDAKADLIAPQKTVVIQIVQDICFIGVDKSEDLLVKEIKVHKKYEQRPLNRAELKLREAVEIFGIKLKPEWRALDIGASPGGWTKVLAEKVKEVVAVDPGELEIDLPNVTHIRKRIENTEHLGKFDIIVNDMNLNPEESAQIMCRLSEHLRKEGIAVMTVKFVTKNQKKHVENANNVLSKCYDVLQIKRMPHNKFEITLFMVKKQNLKSS